MGPALGPRQLIGGLPCQDFLPEEGKPSGSGAAAAREGQEVVVKFSLRSSQKAAKVLERGEVGCFIGKGEVLDGWVDGNVDLEEVLASWSRGLIGMRAGIKRRIFIPPRLGFREGGGDVASGSVELLWDVELKKLK